MSLETCMHELATECVIPICALTKEFNEQINSHSIIAGA